ncbi:MAG: hypothetical protein R6U63_04610 [Longimicrobiales bacterium]
MTRVQRRSWAGSLMGILAVTVTLVACGGGGQQGTRTPAAESTGPALTVERFLRAANANSLGTMTELFGTTDRTIVQLEGQTRAEERMYVLASLLRHDDWSIVGQQSVPGRMMDAIDLLVRITRGDESVTVPFLVVRREDGGWIIERIEVEPLTTLPSPR